SSSVAIDPVTGFQYTSQNDVFTIGAGYLDIPAALANTDVANGTALSPKVAYDSATGIAYLVGDTSAMWGSSAVWGTSAVWGSSAVWGTSAMWGSTTVLGNSAMWGSSAVWGTSAMWGSGSPVISEAITIAVNGEN